MSKKVSVIIPTRNEEKFITNTLDSLLAQDYPTEWMEIIIADGRSDDQTRILIKPFEEKHSFIRLIDNPEQVVPFALNYAIKESSGEVIIRLDAHSIYPVDYISRLVDELYKNKADNVGGVWVTTPANQSNIAVSIALATSHPLGIGDANYRLESNQVREVDTVPFGCFRKSVFDKIGLFDTDLIRNQDDEFNGRIIKNGGKIFLVPDVKITYFARRNLFTMRKMFYQYGLFKPLVNKKLGAPATLRQFVPPIFVLGVLSGLIGVLFPAFAMLWTTGIIFYMLVLLAVSFKIAIDAKRVGLFLTLPTVFVSIHLSYGWGYIVGFVKTVILNQYVGKSNFSTSR